MARPTAPSSSPSPAPSFPCAEAGFSLVEVLAALTIAALMLVAVLEVFSGASKAGHRLEMETAARSLGRALLAEGRSGTGQTGRFRWSVDSADAGNGTVLRQVRIGWAGNGALAIDRLDVPGAGTSSGTGTGNAP